MNHPTRDRLLAEARSLFAAHGYDRASVRAITRRARANLGAVTYHFGSKRKLYDAVVAELLGTLAREVAAACAAPGPAPARIAGVVHALFAFFARYPETPRILLRELATSGTPPAAVAPVAQRNFEAISAVVREGQANGELRPVDPLLVAFSIVSQSIWFAVVRQAHVPVARALVDRPDAAALVERHVADLVTRGLAPAGAAA